MSQAANPAPESLTVEKQASGAPGQATFTAQDTATMKHPLGLYVLFGTEMWERFCYYGMRALLVLYLVEHHGWQPSEANSVFKWYTSLAYLAPLIGGFLADRYLGLRASITLGGLLMGIGGFFLTREPIQTFYMGLGLLIAGTGLFKPNVTTMVGRMYVPGDVRRDRAFTIFYMGINIGGLVAPLICGQWLRAHYGFNYGFGATSVAMIFSLIIFLGFRKQVERDVIAAGNTLQVGAKVDHKESVAARKAFEDEARPMATGPTPWVGRGFVMVLGVLFGVVIPIYFIAQYIKSQVPLSGVFMPVAVAAISIWMTMCLIQVKGAARDKSMVIFVLFVFQLLFWMAFEQAGNALNLWAEFHTQRKVIFFDMEAEAYQSVNGIAIVIFAPIFAWIWLQLNRVGREPSTPMKMAISMIFIGLSSFAMVGATTAENTTESRMVVEKVPASIDLSKFDAGRLRYDAAAHELVAKGTLPSYVVNDALKQSADAKYVDAVEALVKDSANASPEHPIAATLPGIPAEYEPLGAVAKMNPTWDSASHTLRVTAPIDPPARTMLLSEGAPPEWRKPLRALAAKSDAARVTGFWLMLSYLLATFGELCISPVGFSMVTKLAPTRFASLFMGVWLLTNSVAQYIGGTIGESWGKVAPTNYFSIFVASSAVGAVLCFLLVRPVRKLMHEAH